MTLARTPKGRPSGRFTQHRRMSQLRQFLAKHPKGVTLAEIAAQLNVTRRSARRYLSELRSSHNDFDLEAIDHAGEKRWRIPAIDAPRRLAVRRTQAYALLAARPLFDGMRGSAVHQELELAAEHLVGLARRPGRGPNAGMLGDALERRFRYVPFAPIDYAAHGEELDCLFQAVADLRPVSLSYGAEERLVVHPYALVLYKEALYALGLDVAAGAVRTLELRQVRGARLFDDQRFALPAGFAVDDYCQGQFGLWRREGAATRAVIDFDASVADELGSRRFHASQRLERITGGVRMHLELGDTRELCAWVMGFGPLAVVREPRALRDQVARALRAALGRYQRARKKASARR